MSRQQNMPKRFADFEVEEQSVRQVVRQAPSAPIRAPAKVARRSVRPAPRAPTPMAAGSFNLFGQVDLPPTVPIIPIPLNLSPPSQPSSLQQQVAMLQQQLSSIAATMAVERAPTVERSEFDDVCCFSCGNGNNAESLVLCDGCDRGCHTQCMNLTSVPIGDWYCPRCVNSRAASAAPAAASESASAPAQIGVLKPGMRVIVYERVSSKGQDAPQFGRVGLLTQNSDIVKFTLDKGLVIDRTISEVHSARNPDQLAQLNNALKTIKKGPRNTGADCILVYDVSRFARNAEKGTLMLDQIHRAGGFVYSVSENVSSHDLRFLQLLREAQTMSDNLSAKMAASIARRRRLGSHIGPAPFGKRIHRLDDGRRTLQNDAHEQAVIDRIRMLHARGGGVGKVRLALNTDRVFNRQGKPWSTQQVSKIIASSKKNIRSFAEDMKAALD